MNIFESWLVKKPIAHRGFHNSSCPENSISAFNNAIKNGYTIELDVRALKDGTVVVFHDNKLGRMTGNDGYITNFNYDEIKKLKLLKTKERIPTLKEALKTINGKTPVIIEIKNDNKVGELEKEVWNILATYKGDYVVQSFNPFTLEWFKNNAPQVKRGQIASFFKDQDLPFFKRFTLKRMLLNKKVSEPNFISYDVSNLPNKYVKKYKDIPLLAWVVKNQEEYDKVKKLCDNIIFEGFKPKTKTTKK